MILIADCGSTKIEWCLIDGLTQIVRFNTAGMNALLVTGEEITARLIDEVTPRVTESGKVDKVYFYGAGCVDRGVCETVERAIERAIPGCKAEVASDLLGAARALCGNKPGIACILGTGSNSCLYDGEKIVDNVSPLGYILGDEGSGAVLGRQLVGDVLKRQLPADLCREFLTRYDLDTVSIIKRVYREPAPNRFLASVTPFLLEHIEEPAIHRLVLNAFKAFFVRNIANYPDYRNRLINVTGSIGYFYRDVLKEAADAMDCTLGTVLPTPMEGMIAFHASHHK